MAIVFASVVIDLVRLLKNEIPKAIKNFWFLATYWSLYSILSMFSLRADLVKAVKSSLSGSAGA